jgi:hypothetical protein
VSASASTAKLEAKPKLHFDDASTEPVLRLAEVRAEDVGLDVGQVEPIEDVEEVGAELDLSVLTDDLHVRQTERLAECRVHAEVTGTVELTAMNARRGWDRANGLLPARTCRGVWIREEAVK